MKTTSGRAAALAAQYRSAQAGFIQLVESLSPAQWSMTGKNYPSRTNDEDEGRTVGVIAHHVAEAEVVFIERLFAMLQDREVPRLDSRALNAAHAARRAQVTKDEVLQLLQANRAIPDRIGSLSDEELERSWDTAVGPLSVAQRVERVMIGHIAMHHGSIEAAIA